MTRFDIKTSLPAILQVEDRTSMSVSLEVRVPLLDHRIAELVASMPPKYKYKGGRSKYIFRKVIQHIVPPEILNRKDKMGFPVPLNEWYKKEPVKSFIYEILCSNRAKTRGIFNHKNMEMLLEKERPYGRNIWGLLCLELWFRLFIDGEYKDYIKI
jgi:asparagine synthase (glutamine-hydrolysing)